MKHTRELKPPAQTARRTGQVGKGSGGGVLRAQAQFTSRAEVWRGRVRKSRTNQELRRCGGNGFTPPPGPAPRTAVSAPMAPVRMGGFSQTPGLVAPGP